MASKIAKARLATDRSSEIRAAEYVKEKHGAVLCPDRRCLCRLRGVSATTRTVDGAKIHVAAYFGLPPNAEKSGRGHAPQCRYNLPATIQRLVRRSKEIRKFNEDDESLLAGGQGQPAEYRLHILMELFGSRKGINVPDPEEIERAGLRKQGVNYKKSEKSLRSYFRIAQAIHTLIARVQDKSDLKKNIRLMYGREHIQWSDYFYDLGEYGALHDYLLQKKQVIGSRQGSFPVAVVVEPDQRRELHQTQYGKWAVSCRTAVCKNGDQQRIVTCLVFFIQPKVES